MPTRQPIRIGFILLLAAMAMTSARGETSSNIQTTAPAEICYGIPALPMNEAIARFAQASDVDILYDRRLVEGMMSAPIFGSFTPQAGIARLLGGTGLASRFLRPKSAVIFLENKPNAAPMEKSGAKGPSLDLDPVNVRASPIIGSDMAEQFIEYGKRTQAQIYGLLKSDSTLLETGFQIRIAVLLNNEGRIAGLRFLQGTGDKILDEQIGRVLNGAQLSTPPPSGLPQPMKFMILSK